MRLRAALLGAGMAVMAVSALGAPAQAAPAEAAAWTWIGHYQSKAKCVEVGTQYVREGFDEYKCPHITASGYYSLWVR